MLLKNNGLLPLSVSSKIAVFGNGIARVIKGGTGSGDVNERAVVSMVEGLAAAGYHIVNKESAEKYAADYAEARIEWRDQVLQELEKRQGGSDMAFFDIIANTKERDIKEMEIKGEELQNVGAVLYIIKPDCRRGMRPGIRKKGDYYLTDLEKKAAYRDRKNIIKILLCL